MANGMSLRPSTFSAGGGLIDDMDVEIKRARFVSYDYDGKADRPALCLMILMADSDGTEHVQYYSAGDLQYFVPSENPKNEDENGITCVQVGEKSSLNGGTNAAILLNSLVQAGFPEDKLDSGDVRVMEGMKAHVNRVPQPKRSNLPKKEGAREAMVLVVTSIISLPGESKGKASATKNAGSTTAKGASTATSSASQNGNAAASDDLTDELIGHLIGIFAEKGVTEMKKVEIGKALFSAIDKTDPNRNKLVSLGSKDEVLKSLEGFSFNGSVLTQD